MEKAGDFAFADKIFKKALSKGAEPKKVLEERQRQFQRRMSRHWLNAGSSNGGKHSSDSHDEENENDGSLRRGKLAVLSTTGAGNNHRARAMNETNGELRSNPSNFANPISSRQKGSSGNKTKAASGGGFSIYVDGDANEGSHADIDAPPFVRKHQPKMATDSERRKENILDAEQWNKRGGLHSSNTRSEDDDNRNHAMERLRTVNAAPKFEVFVEEVFVDEEFASDTNQNNRTVNNQTKVDATPYRSIRERLESGVVSVVVSWDVMVNLGFPFNYKAPSFSFFFGVCTYLNRIKRRRTS